jgi:integrase
MAKESKFNPTIYKGRQQVTVKSAYQGIRNLYVWCPEKKKYLQRKDGKRFVAFKKVFGVQKEQHFERLEDAQRWRLTGEALKSEITKILFRDLMNEYFNYASSRVNESTLKTYKNSTKHLEIFFDMPVTSITSFVIDEWLIRIKQPDYLALQHDSRFTYQKELKVLKQILKYYAEYKDRSETYVIPIKPRHSKDAIVSLKRMKEAKSRNQERYLSEKEIIDFFSAFSAITNEENKCFLFIANLQLQTGARIGEAAALSWSDVDFDKNQISISKTVHWGRGKDASTYIQKYTKTGESRAVPMTEALKRLLLHLKSVSSQGLIFTQGNDLPLSYRSIQHYYNRAFELSGIKWRSTHILRHTFSTNFLTATKDHLTLAKFLGHSSTRQTEHYAKVTGTLTSESFKSFNEDLELKLGNVLNFRSVAG